MSTLQVMAHKETTIEEMSRVAQLARLDLDQASLEAFRRDLDEVLSHVEKLNPLQISDVEPMARPHEAVNRLDEDVPESAMSRDTLLEMAPEVIEPYISVPKVLEEGDA